MLLANNGVRQRLSPSRLGELAQAAAARHDWAGQVRYDQDERWYQGHQDEVLDHVSTQQVVGHRFKRGSDGDPETHEAAQKSEKTIEIELSGPRFAQRKPSA